MADEYYKPEEIDRTDEFTNDASQQTQEGANERVGTDDVLRAVVNRLLEQLQEPEPWPKELVNPEDTSPQKPDIYTLIGALTALRQEISLQGRSFNRLQQLVESMPDGTEPLKSIDEKLLQLEGGFDPLRTAIEQLSSQSLAAERQAGLKEGKKQAFDSMIEPLLDTHDHIRRMVEHNRLRLKTGGWKSLLFKKDSETGLVQTMALSHKKMSQRLIELGITECARIGDPFDPVTMKAVEIVESGESPVSAVIEIFRQGYTVEGRVLRFAEVKVTNPSSAHERI